jgi:histidinol-phosphate aminotransferase
MNFNLQNLLRPNIATLKPYTSARDEYKGKEGVFLDANENSFGSVTFQAHNRYPDPLQWEVKFALSKIKSIPAENMLIGNGSDEPIDLLFRCFCIPSKDNVIITPPTYGMYEVSANINDIAIKKAYLTSDFQLDVNNILDSVDINTKLIFLCSPNNPTGNLLQKYDIEHILNSFSGIVVIDEAYIDFTPNGTSFVPQLLKYPNLVILQTFSKAWGMANLRLGLAYASIEIINIFNKVKPPYNVNGLSQKLALEAISNEVQKNVFVNNILNERYFLMQEFEKLPFVLKVYPSDANFFLVKTHNGKKIYDYLVGNKIIVRDRSNVKLCEGCLRITVGTHRENIALLDCLKSFK